MTLKIAQRRERQLDALIEAAERRMQQHGLQGIKARELADEIGIALGAIYNLVADLDELVLRVSARTLNKLDATLTEAVPSSAPRTREDAAGRLVAIAIAYRKFASDNTQLWRNLFEHRMRPDSIVPEWATGSELHLFRHISAPLRVLMPKTDETQLYLMARTLFSAVHGIVTLGLEDRNVGVPVAAQDAQIEKLVRIICKGLR
jgi:AcrR family transcriptional regulator